MSTPDKDIDFKATMADQRVKPLACKVEVEMPCNVSSKPKQPTFNQARDQLRQAMANCPPPDPVSANTELSHFQSGVLAKQRKQLKQGQVTATATLDLHGHTVAESEHQLTEFLHQAVLDQKRCVLIIHGRGSQNPRSPTLKNQVNAWLRAHPGVIGFCSAQPKHGGTGAVYVLLKRQIA